MDEHCPASCELEVAESQNNPRRVLQADECDDLHERCPLWAKAGKRLLCKYNPGHINSHDSHLHLSYCKLQASAK
jgi:hypothetical protein